MTARRAAAVALALAALGACGGGSRPYVYHPLVTTTTNGYVAPTTTTEAYHTPTTAPSNTLGPPALDSPDPEVRLKAWALVHGYPQDVVFAIGQRTCAELRQGTPYAQVWAAAEQAQRTNPSVDLTAAVSMSIVDLCPEFLGR